MFFLFLEVCNFKFESVVFVIGFVCWIGDFVVISKIDLDFIVLVYEIECEWNGGDWCLR